MESEAPGNGGRGAGGIRARAGPGHGPAQTQGPDPGPRAQALDPGPACIVDKDRNDQGTTGKLVDAGFLVSDKFRGKNMFDFFFQLA